MHWTHCRRVSVGLTGAITALAIVASTAPAATLQPVSQQRSINGMVIVPPCSPSPISDQIAARGFDPFDESLEVSRICDFAHGISGARQVSTIGGATITAFGQSECNVFSLNYTIIHSIPSSTFDLTFQLTHDVDYEITGSLIVEGGPPVIVAYVRLRLTDAKQAVVVEHIIEPGPNGELVSFEIDDAGQLEPGTYRLQLDAVSAVDSPVPPFGLGHATFITSASFQRAGDVTLDGSVGVADVLAVINAWGACDAPPSECPADLAPPGGDGTVGVPDLMTVINHWG